MLRTCGKRLGLATVFSPRRMSTSSSKKLSHLRDLMQKSSLDGYVVPAQDAHLSEYVADVDKCREWLTGFTGSAGTAVVTKTEALLWTDGRYYEQAERELKGEWKLMRSADPGVKQIPDYLKEQLPAGSRVGINAHTVSISLAKKWDRILSGDCKSCKTLITRSMQDTRCEHCVTLMPVENDLIGEVWGKTRPNRPAGEIVVHPLSIAGESTESKLSKLREALEEEDASMIFFAALDEIAWLLNLRGSDILYTPVFFSYLVVTKEEVVLFANKSAITDTVSKYLTSVGCTKVLPYDETMAYLATTVTPASSSSSSSSAETRKKRKIIKTSKVWLDPDACGLGIYNLCSTLDPVLLPSPVKRSKAIKNEKELQGMRDAHVFEGVALCKYFAWLEAEMAKPDTDLTELSTSEKIESFRNLNKEYHGPSFDTISSYGPNGAVIHYKPTKETSLRLGKDSLYLCDTGGQYSMGTTDMTRTVCFREDPTPEQKLAFTLVLEGHIALAQAVVPEGTEPCKLDIIARSPLWKRGLDYKHGTSHGVGAYLGVHEYPPLMHGFGQPTKSFKGKLSPTSFVAGMALSNEPGYYSSGSFGIRIENVMLSREKQDVNSMSDKSTKWLEFETITLVPIQTRLVDTDVLTSAGLEWLNSYHQKCREILGPLLKDDEVTYKWLMEETKKV